MVIDIKARPTRERDQKLRKLLQSPDAELVSMVALGISAQ